MDADENRKAIRLGKCDRKSADAIARHVEHLLNAKLNGGTVPRETAAWLADIGAKLRGKLAAGERKALAQAIPQPAGSQGYRTGG